MNTNFNDLPLDAKLSAWLDDELSAEQRAEVEAWLRDHPEDTARVRLWAADRDVLRARLEPALEEPVPARLEQIVWNHAPSMVPAGWHRLAAALAVFAFGGLLGAGGMWRWHDATTHAASANGSWLQRAAVAHAVYVPEQRHPVEVAVAGQTADEGRAQEEHLVRWLTKRLDVPVKLFDLRAQGYELVGGRLLPDAAGPSAQLMYQPIGEANAPRVTVYLRKSDSAAPAAFRYERQGELGLFYWVEGRAGYALVGALPRERLLALCEVMYKQSEDTR
ncbi:anti-sigma factor family protein [Piscinibacter sp.]|jgi:anti-sigma factor RsiW|uniref:anti-sigma factor family protein n=1 Tax=Piscinibacter sp. TaxID=1903157 RepID=UPI003559C39E